MDKKELMSLLNELKKEISSINEKIDIVIRQINDDTSENTTNDGTFKKETWEINPNPNLLDSFISYMKNELKLKSGSIKDYCAELRRIRDKLSLFANVQLSCEIYYIEDLSTIYKINEIFKSNADFRKLNMDAHYSLSAALNNYIKFLENKNTDFILDE